MGSPDTRLRDPALAFGTVAEGKAFIGRRTERRDAINPVSERTVRLFSALIEDGNPLYWHGAFCPPALLLSFDFRYPWHPDPTVDLRPSRIFREVPLPGHFIVNVETDSEHVRRIRVGDVVSLEGVVEDVSDTKVTRLGSGNFIRSKTSYFDSAGRLLAINTNVLFRYDPHDVAPAAPLGGRPTSPEGPQTSAPLQLSAAMPGMRLHDADVHVSFERICQVTATTGDWYPGHYSSAFAESQGQPTIFASTLHLHGLIDRYVTDLFGPDAFVHRRRMHMRSSVYADTEAVVRAEVAAVDPQSGRVRVALRIESDDRVCVTAEVTVGEFDE
ncbi:FAS1-like dehydratase domain-containing protein [Streptomyces sp. NPDC004685]